MRIKDAMEWAGAVILVLAAISAAISLAMVIIGWPLIRVLKFVA